MRYLTLILATLLVGASLSPAEAAQSKAEAQAEIWAKEQSIYASRGRGDLKTYIDNVATDYLAWPPYSPRPTGVGALQVSQPKMAKENMEILTMEFVDFAYNGDSAVIYYQTHRTRLPNGAAADERFEVTHSWVRENGTWRVLGGMARPRPVRP